MFTFVLYTREAQSVRLKANAYMDIERNIQNILLVRSNLDELLLMNEELFENSVTVAHMYDVDIYLVVQLLLDNFT